MSDSFKFRIKALSIATEPPVEVELGGHGGGYFEVKDSEEAEQIAKDIADNYPKLRDPKVVRL